MTVFFGNSSETNRVKTCVRVGGGFGKRRSPCGRRLTGPETRDGYRHRSPGPHPTNLIRSVSGNDFRPELRLSCTGTVTHPVTTLIPLPTTSPPGATGVRLRAMSSMSSSTNVKFTRPRQTNTRGSRCSRCQET